MDDHVKDEQPAEGRPPWVPEAPIRDVTPFDPHDRESVPITEEVAPRSTVPEGYMGGDDGPWNVVTS